MNTALIVDDEATARKRLLLLLEKHEDAIRVIGEASDGREAIEKIDSLKPDVVFLDIQIPEISGIDLTGQLQHVPFIVFVTAYHEHAVKAFEQNSLDYIVKPVDAARLAITVQRIANTAKRPDVQTQFLQKMLNELQQKTPKLDTIPVKLASKIILVPVQSVIYFEAKEKYVYVHTPDDRYLIDYTLTYLESRLPDNFLRIHRTFIVNRQMIKEIHKHLKGTFLFVMKDKAQSKLTSGNTYYDIIRDMLAL